MSTASDGSRVDLGKSEALRRLLEQKEEEEEEDESMDAVEGNGVTHHDNEEEADMGGGGGETAGLRNLTADQQAVLRGLDQRDMLKLVDRLMGGEALDATLQDVGQDVIQQLKKAAEDQYKTLELQRNAGEGDRELTSLDIEENSKSEGVMPKTSSDGGIDIMHMAKFTPIRLTYDERKFLRLLESALEVSEYTDKVDILCTGSKARRMAREIKQMCAILSGLVVANSYEDGQQLIRDRNFAKNAVFFQSVFEIGRRYKILNPERMRDSYGKLVYLLMDSRKPDIHDLLDFDCVQQVNTVYDLLQRKKGGLKLLEDPLIRVATSEILAEGKTRSKVQEEIRQKEAAIEHLVQKHATVKPQGMDGRSRKLPGLFGLRYTTLASLWGGGPEDEEEEGMMPDMDADGLCPEDIRQCLYSLCDHNTYLRYNRDPCDKMIRYLKKYFDPRIIEPGYNLSIQAGRGGARLTHSHERQYTYVLQSLTLWREVLHEMMCLWTLAERDLLDSENIYRLRDTGQGLNRVQCAPQVSRAMNILLRRAQEKVGGWVGSSAVHLGDHNVPNALMFIDKYTQIPRILGPLVLCLEKIPQLCVKPALRKYLDDAFGGHEVLIKSILCDFFRHAFDGSGADNFFDAGSCIDGRLTSAWNWCSLVEKKSFYPVFLLTGFVGFDGRF